MDEAVARTSFIGVSDTGREFPVEVIVSKPRPGEEFGWVCSVAVTGIDARPYNISGIDSFQALSLGLQMVEARLKNFVENGGQLLCPEEREPFPLRAYFPEEGGA